MTNSDIEQTAQKEKNSGSFDHKESASDVQIRERTHDFGGEEELPPAPKLTLAEEKALYRKIDIRILPILSIMYLFSFMDRGNIGNAKIQGLTTQLHLTGNRYNIALTMYFISYCLFECPANLVLKRLRPSRWLPSITVVWGTVMTLMGLVKSYPQLVGVRVALGIAEAGLFPGVVYYLTLWYPRSMLNYRIGLFFGAASVAGAFSGILAFGIVHLNGKDHFEGWSWIFIIEGIATVVVGCIAFFVLVDFPVTAKFLTPEEKAYVVQRKKYDSSSVGEAEAFQIKYMFAAFMDWQIWLHILVYMSLVGPLYGISLFLPSIINGFGFSAINTQLLTVPCYVCATILLLIFAHYSDRLGMRSPFIVASLCLELIGFVIQIGATSRNVKYFGTFLIVMGSYAGFPAVVAWLGNNLSGQYKRGVGMAMHIGIGNFSGAIASNIFRTQDAPRYILGHGIELMFVGIGFITLPIIVITYRRINAKRDRIAAGLEPGKTQDDYTVQELRDLGDRAPDFRYMF